MIISTSHRMNSRVTKAGESHRILKSTEALAIKNKQ
jgi:hypothetical protein